MRKNKIFRWIGLVFTLALGLGVVATSNALMNGVKANDPSLPETIRNLSDGVIQLLVVRNTKTPCTGVHLGEGWVLTARHCIEGARGVGLYSNPARETGRSYTDLGDLLDRNSYTIQNFEPLNFEGNSFRVPDLVLLHAIDSALLEKYRKLPHVPLAERPYRLEEFTDVFTYGYGTGNSEESPHVAKVILEPYQETMKHYSASSSFAQGAEYLWGARANETRARTAPGDSGGPLVGLTRDGEPVLIGINFTEATVENSALEEHFMAFTRMDHPYVLAYTRSLRVALNPEKAAVSCEALFE